MHPTDVRWCPPGLGALAAALGDAAHLLRYQGVRPFLWRVLVRALAPVGALRLAVLCEKDLREPLPEVPARGPLEIGGLAEAEVDRLVAMMMDGAADAEPVGRLRMLDRVLRDFRSGALCFVARHGADLVHSNWIHFAGGAPIETVPGRYLSLERDEAYMTDGFTPKAWRGKGIHAAVNSQMLCFLRAQGYRKAYTQVNAENVSSRKGLERVGWTPAGVLLSFAPPGRRCRIWRVRGTLGPWVTKPSEPDRIIRLPLR